MASKLKTLVIAPSGISARRTFTHDWLMPGNAGLLVRHIYNTSSMRDAKRLCERAGVPFGPIWIGPDAHRMLKFDTDNIVELANEWDVPLKSYKEHPGYQNWPLRCAVDPEFEIAHREVYIADSRVVAMNIARMDWGMPPDFIRRVRIITDLDGDARLSGLQGAGKTIWLGPGFSGWHWTKKQALIELAYHRGFAVGEFYRHPMYHHPGARLLP